MQHKSLILISTVISTVAATMSAGCRGETSHNPPVHLVQNMDFQDKLKAQSESLFPNWKDKRGMRMPVKGTVAHTLDGSQRTLGALSSNPAVAKLHTYKDAYGKYVSNPLPRTLANLERGRERFDIHCAVCHGRTARGHGIIAEPGRLPLKPPSLIKKAPDDRPDTRHDPRVLALSDGEIFEVITNGKATMQPYAIQVDVEDRWRIIHYIRALQYR